MTSLPTALYRLARRAVARVLPRRVKEAVRPFLDPEVIRMRLRLPALRRELRRLVGSHDPKRVIVYLPTIDWGYLHQRPQQLAKALARKGYLFFYCTPNSRNDHVVDFECWAPNLYLCHVPLEVFAELESPTVLLSWTINRAFLRHFRPSLRLIYDVIDDLTVFDLYGPEMERDHLALLEQASVVVATADRLLESCQTRRPDVVFAPNAADYEHFCVAAKRPETPPPSLEPVVARGKPIVGYYGAIASWLSFDWLVRLATDRPDLSLVLIGPDYDRAAAGERAACRAANLFWLGERPYEQLPSYLAWFDVATIPFRINEITLATSPIKLFEYMSAEKPVVTSAMPECRRYEGIWVAESYDDFRDAVDAALARRDDAALRELMRETARANTWDARAERIATQLERVG